MKDNLSAKAFEICEKSDYNSEQALKYMTESDVRGGLSPFDFLNLTNKVFSLCNLFMLTNEVKEIYED